jgi:hypothetical protein
MWTACNWLAIRSSSGYSEDLCFIQTVSVMESWDTVKFNIYIGKRPVGRPMRRWEDIGSEWILGRLAWGVWIGFDWLRTGTGGGMLWVRWWTCTPELYKVWIFHCDWMQCSVLACPAMWAWGSYSTFRWLYPQRQGWHDEWHVYTRAWSRASAVKGRRLTAWAMGRPGAVG